MNKPNNTRKAYENDFRTPHNTFKINVEYYEKMLYTNNWELRISDEETDREWLKTKICTGCIEVPVPIVLWNQKEVSKRLAG